LDQSDWAYFTLPLLSTKIKAGFWVMLFSAPHLVFGYPYYEPLLWFMIIKGFSYCEFSFLTKQHLKASLDGHSIKVSLSCKQLMALSLAA